MPRLIGAASHGPSVPKKTATVSDETSGFRPYDSGEHMAQWLQEAARRTQPPSSPDPQPAASALPIAQESAVRSVPGRAKWPLMAVLVAIAFLQYFYVDVMVQIASLPAMIFFILINGQMPPM
jgi:hypothetical protein